MTSVPDQEALDDVTPAQHEKKLQVAVHFRTLAFISVAAVYALSTFGDQVPTHAHTLSIQSVQPSQTTLQPCLSSALTFLWAVTLCAPRGSRL